MRVLFVHPDDELPADDVRWDLVVDLARAPRRVYDDWTSRTGGRVLSLYDYAQEVEDLYCTRDMLQRGLGKLQDEFGIDWWDVCSLMISPDMQRFMLVLRLVRELDPSSELHCTRSTPLVCALESVLRQKIIVHQKSRAFNAVGSALNAVRRLDPAQLLQVLQDKFDPYHRVRRRFAKKPKDGNKPVVLAPSAYINVSRTIQRYVEAHPDQNFYLVTARRSAWITPMNSNLQIVSLDGYVSDVDEAEISRLLSEWGLLKAWLASSSKEFFMASAAGVLDRVPSLIRWGVAARDAWLRVFETQNVVACFCADDSNPYTRIPLILANKRRLPTTVSHHGALDNRLAFKRNYADCYLAKSEMERDYAVRVCGMERERVRLAIPSAAHLSQTRQTTAARTGYLVFFTEAYHSADWREAEIYRELIPELLSVSEALGLTAVIKLHPFDGIKKIRSYVRQVLPAPDRAKVRIWSGTIGDSDWPQVQVALTAQSSVALECQERRIPVFLCEWLRDPFSGYVSQFVRYGVGKVLHAPEQIAELPEMLRASTRNAVQFSASTRAELVS